jgi:alpha-mannosidase
MPGTHPARQSHHEPRDGTLVLAADKPPETGTGLVLRLWNPGGQTTTDTLVFARKPSAARTVKLNEAPGGPGQAILADHSLRVTAAPRQIVTIHLEFTEQ